MSERGWRYVALADELAAWVDGGVLVAGERLPSVRRLAEEKRLSVSTVVQALRQLEQRGLVEARPQSGYYVCVPASRPPPRPRQPPEAASTVAISARLVDVLQAGGRPGIVPLAAALPDSVLLPVAALQRLYAGVARRYSHLLGGGSHVHMDEPVLIRQLVRRSLAWGGPLASEEILITNSCTEAMNLCLRAVTRPGDTVAVESPAYYLMLQLLETLGLKALEIPCDPRDGMSVEALDLATRGGGVAACLLVPNASNPLGSVMPDERKRRLATLTAARNIPVIEDDIYGDLHFGGQRPWPVKAFDRAGNVMLCSSFSKSLSPSLRIGFVAAGRHAARLALLRTVGSGGTNPITQHVLAEYLESGAYERQLRALRKAYARQVEAMQAAVTRHFPESTRFTAPQGGCVLWVELPEEVDASALHTRAIAQGVAFVPGELFSVSGLYRHCLRLNCGNPMTPVIEDAVRRLGQLVSAAPRAAGGRQSGV